MIETLKIECPKTEDNPAGFYVINAEDKTADMKVFEDEAPKDEAPKDEAPKDEAPKDEAPKDKTPDDMTVAELRDALTAAGVEFPDNAKKADLAALLASLEA